MKIKGKQDIEYWMTTGRNGAMIRVYRIDPRPEQAGDRFNPFQVPILVDYYNHGESIADILEQRDKFRVELSQYKESYEILKDEVAMMVKPPIRIRKWYQFWK